MRVEKRRGMNNVRRKKEKLCKIRKNKNEGIKEGGKDKDL